MADRFYSVVKGEFLPEHVTEGSGTSGETIELRVNDAVWANKIDVILALEAIRGFLETKETSPIV